MSTPSNSTVISPEQVSKQLPSMSKWGYAGIVAAIIITVCIMIYLGYLYRHRRHQARLLEKQQTIGKSSDHLTISTSSASASDEEAGIPAGLKDFETPKIIVTRASIPVPEQKVEHRYQLESPTGSPRTRGGIPVSRFPSLPKFTSTDTLRVPATTDEEVYIPAAWLRPPRGLTQ